MSSKDHEDSLLRPVNRESSVPLRPEGEALSRGPDASVLPGESPRLLEQACGAPADMNQDPRSVARELIDVVTAARGFAELGLTLVDPSDPVSQDLSEIRSATDRAALLAKQLLDTFRDPAPLDVAMRVASLEPFLRRLAGNDVDFEVRCESAPMSVRMAAGSFEQMLVTLVVNAKDSLSAGGRILVESRVIDVDESFAAQHPPLRRGRYVVLRVDDNGAGLSEDLRARMFESDPGEAKAWTGLATVRSLVAQRGGAILVDSSPRLGTCLTIYLPSVEVSSNTVVLLEDEQQIRRVVKQILEENGFRVVEFETGDAALNHLRSAPPGSFGVFLTDVSLTRSSGPLVAQQVRLLHPGIPIVFMTGHPADRIRADGPVFPDAGFVPKPFRKQELLGAIRQALRIA
jgi:two-component system cell cycle sensor histidine kinase/response regulator CckA